MVDVAKKNVELVPLDSFDLSCQTRTKLNAAAVQDYRAMIVNGEDLDPGIAYRTDDGQVLLSAGFHRLAAYRKAGRDLMPVEIRSGTGEEARFWAIRAGIGDNLKHVGVRLTRADRQRTVEMLLGEKPEYGDAVIAKMAEVHPDTVARCRRRLEKTATIRNAGSRVGLDGKMRDTSRIGRKPRGKAAPGSVAWNEQASESSTLGGQQPETPPTSETVDLLGDVQGGKFSERPDNTAAIADAEPSVDAGDSSAHPSGRPIEDCQETAKDSPLTPAGSEPILKAAEDRCPCGQDWESDGEGGRFCLECGENHPTTPSVNEEPITQGSDKLQENVPAQGESEVVPIAETPRDASRTCSTGNTDDAQVGLLARLEELLTETHEHLAKVEANFPGRYAETRRGLESLVMAFVKERNEQVDGGLKLTTPATSWRL